MRIILGSLGQPPGLAALMRSGIPNRSTIGLMMIAMSAFAPVCFSDICHSQTSDASSSRFSEGLQHQHATLVLRTSLGGSHRDFHIDPPAGDPIPKQLLA